MADGRVVIEAILDATNVKRGVSELARSIKGVSWENIAAGDKEAQRLSRAFSAAGTAFTAKFTMPITAALGLSAKLSLEFDKAMSKVATIADTTEVPLEQLRTEILALSDDTGIAATDIADNVYNAISAGQKTGDAVQFVANASKLATAGFAESGQALDILTTTLNAYKMESSETQRVSDVLLQTQNKGKTTVAELSASMGKAIPTASAFNVNLENLAATYATTTANGIATAESTTYINSMIKELGDTSSEVGKILKERTGKSFADLMAEGMSLGDALVIVRDAGAETNKTMYDMFGSAEAATAAASIAGDGAAKFAENLDAMNNAAGSTDEAFETMQDTSWTLAKGMNEVKNVGIKLGDSLVNGLKPHIQRICKALSDFCEWFDSLEQGEKDAVIQTALLVAAIGPLLSITGKMIPLVPKLNTGLKALKGGLAGASSEAGGLTKALGGVKGGVAGIIAIAFVAVIAMWASEMKKAADHAETYRKATDGLKEAHSALNEEVVATASAMDDVDTSGAQRSFEDLRDAADDCIESQAQLADDLKAKWSDVNTDAALVERYVGTIDELTNKYDENGAKAKLSAEEQAKLKAAVQGYNEVTGDSVSIIDAVNGKLDVSNDELRRNKDAWLANAKAQAAQESITEVMKQRIKTEKELHDTENKRNELGEKIRKQEENGLVVAQQQIDEYTTLDNKVNELNGSISTCDEELDYYTQLATEAASATNQSSQAAGDNAEAMEGQAGAASQLSEELQAVVDEITDIAGKDDVFASMLKDSGMSAQDLAVKLDEAGVSVSDLQADIETFKNHTQRAFDEIEVDSSMTLDKMISNLKKNNDITKQWGDDMAILYERMAGQGMDGFLKQLEQAGPEYAAAVHELAAATPEHMQELIDQWGIAGDTAAATALAKLKAKGVDISNVTAETAEAALAAAEQAIANDTSVQEAVDGVVDEASMEKLPVEAGIEGQKVGPELASGIRDQSDDVAAASDEMSKLAADHYSSCTTDAWWAGHSMTADNFLEGMRSANDDVVAHCTWLSKQVADHLSSASMDAWWAGHNMVVVSYSEGMNSGRDTASYAARSLSKLVADHMSASTGDAWWAGRNMAAGMEGGVWTGEWGVVNAIRTVVRRAIAAARKEADIRSPSHKFGWQGEMWDEGLIGGVERKSDDVAEATRDVVRGAIDVSAAEQARSLSSVVSMFADAMQKAKAAAFDPVSGAAWGLPGGDALQIAWNPGGGVFSDPSIAAPSATSRSTTYDNSTGDIVVNMTIERFVNQTDADGDALAERIARKIAARTATASRGRGRG